MVVENFDGLLTVIEHLYNQTYICNLQSFDIADLQYLYNKTQLEKEIIEYEATKI